MKIAIATSDEEKDWYEDIDLLTKALSKTGIESEQVIWDAPKTNWASYDVVCIDSTWNYTDKLENFLDWCKHVSGVARLVNPFKAIQISTNKLYLLTLSESGITIPSSHIYKLGKPLPDALASRYDKIVVKPVVGANGVDAHLFESFKSMNQSSLFAELLMKQDLLIQSYVPEIETLGEIGAIFISGKLSHCVLKMPNGSDFRVQHQYGGVTTLVKAPSYTQELYERVASALGVNPTYMRLDFIPTNTPIVMEVEMVEPHKYFSLYPHGAQLLAKALIS